MGGLVASTAQTHTKKEFFSPKYAEQSPNLSTTAGAGTALPGEGKLLKGFSGTKLIFFWLPALRNLEEVCSPGF